MKLHDLLHEFQESVSFQHLANRTVASAYGTDLGLVESTLMAELIGNPSLTAAQLAERTLLSKVEISRCLTKAERKELITRVASQKDKRARAIGLTTLGKKQFSTAYAEAQKTFSAAFERIPQNQREEFQRLMLQFCDDLPCPQAVVLPEDPPLMNLVRRWTRGFGLLSNRMFWIAELSPLEWHCLRLCEQTPHCARDLKVRIATQPSTISGLLARLEKRKLIKRTTQAGDKRERTISVTQQGHHLLVRSRESAMRLLARGLRRFSDAESQLVVDIWAYYSGRHLGRTTASTSELNEERLVTDTKEAASCRSFIYKTRVQQGLVQNIPEAVAGSNNKIIAFYNGGALIAVLEIMERTAIHALTLKEQVDEKFLSWIVDSAIALCGEEISFREDATSPELWRALVRREQ